MSDNTYLAQHQKRNRILIILGVIALVIVCIYLSVTQLFLDSCTGNFSRDPESVIRAYIDAIMNRNSQVMLDCWQREPFFDITTGCSEVCLSHLAGTQFEVDTVTAGEPVQTEDGRYNLTVQVTAHCPGDTNVLTGEATLDTANTGYPWAHWKIITSNVGGSVAEGWCLP